MTEIYIALISGSMALLGVALTNHNAQKVNKHQQEAERQKHILMQKESLYYKIFASLDMAHYENEFLSNHWKSEDASEEDIEILLQLYAPPKIIVDYHHAMGAVMANLPHQVIVSRMSALKTSIREDLGIKEV